MPTIKTNPTASDLEVAEGIVKRTYCLFSDINKPKLTGFKKELSIKFASALSERTQQVGREMIGAMYCQNCLMVQEAEQNPNTECDDCGNSKPWMRAKSAITDKLNKLNGEDV